MIDQVLSNEARWQNVPFYKSFYSSASFRSNLLLKEIKIQKKDKEKEDGGSR
jgi:hypothetical protein